MPLVGESATLYFQDEIDSSPIVTSCVRKNGITCEAMYDTDLRTVNNQIITMIDFKKKFNLKIIKNHHF